MKKLIYLALLFIIAVTGCEKNNMVAVLNGNAVAPVISTPVNASAVVVTVADTANAFNIKWSKADFGVATVINYAVQIAEAGKNFANPITIGNTDGYALTMTLGSINKRVLNDLSLPANAKSDVEFRVVATLNDKNKATSNAIKVSITTFKELTPEKLYVPGAYQNWTPATAPFIRLVDGFNYEGYVYMNVGDYFKFTSHPDWDHINYGDAGTAGKLTVDGLAGGLKVDVAGYYKLNANTQNLTYSTALIQSFGLIGTATAGAWDISTPMTYDVANGVWKVTTTLVPGALKFRANNNWDINYGPANVNNLTGTLIQTNDAINITAAGNYTVTIDLKQAASATYTYTVVKN